MQKCVGAEQGIRWDQLCGIAFFTGYPYSVALDLDLEVSFAGLAMAKNFVFRIELADNEHYYIEYLWVGQYIIVFRLRELFNVFLTEHIEQLKLCAVQLAANFIYISHKRDIYIGVGTGNNEDVLIKKHSRADREGVRVWAKKAGNRESELTVSGFNDGYRTFTALAFEAQHISLQRKNINRADNS